MGLVLVIIGLILWLATTWTLLGIILFVIGLVLVFVPGTGGYTDWHRRRGP